MYEQIRTSYHVILPNGLSQPKMFVHSARRCLDRLPALTSSGSRRQHAGHHGGVVSGAEGTDVVELPGVKRVVHRYRHRQDFEDLNMPQKQFILHFDNSIRVINSQNNDRLDATGDYRVTLVSYGQRCVCHKHRHLGVGQRDLDCRRCYEKKYMFGDQSVPDNVRRMLHQSVIDIDSDDDDDDDNSSKETKPKTVGLLDKRKPELKSSVADKASTEAMSRRDGKRKTELQMPRAKNLSPGIRSQTSHQRTSRFRSISKKLYAAIRISLGSESEEEVERLPGDSSNLKAISETVLDQKVNTEDETPCDYEETSEIVSPSNHIDIKIKSPSGRDIRADIDTPSGRDIRADIDTPSGYDINRETETHLEDNTATEIGTTLENKIDTEIGKPLEDKIDTEIGKPLEDKIDTEISKPLEDKIDTEIGTPLEDKIDTAISKPFEDKVDTEIGKTLEDKIDTEISKPFEDKVDTEIGKTLEDKIDTEIGSPLDDNIDTEIGTPLEDKIDTEIGKHLEDKLDTEIGKHLEDNIDTEIGSPLRDNINTEIGTVLDDNIDTKIRIALGDNIDTEIGTPLVDTTNTEIGTPLESTRKTPTIQISCPIDVNNKSQIMSFSDSQISYSTSPTAKSQNEQSFVPDTADRDRSKRTESIEHETVSDVKSRTEIPTRPDDKRDAQTGVALTAESDTKPSFSERDITSILYGKSVVEAADAAREKEKHKYPNRACYERGYYRRRRHNAHKRAYLLALSDASARRSKKNPLILKYPGSGPYFSYFPLYVVGELDAPEQSYLEGYRGQTENLKVAGGLRHIIGRLRLRDYYPGGIKYSDRDV
ncbi:uncharacterized protein LOC121377491 [Gigantopelta aegis]|uniref:uncharacterized protein LOC121377491 n=1 Tax=Gigantopelta aegis TaxID=1735272 RepID=UPI001B88AEEE|nr:uncharacterized protein LOC121377491 [Gigantopelta aegis]